MKKNESIGIPYCGKSKYGQGLVDTPKEATSHPVESYPVLRDVKDLCMQLRAWQEMKGI